MNRSCSRARRSPIWSPAPRGAGLSTPRWPRARRGPRGAPRSSGGATTSCCSASSGCLLAVAARRRRAQRPPGRRPVGNPGRDHRRGRGPEGEARRNGRGNGARGEANGEARTARARAADGESDLLAPDEEPQDWDEADRRGGRGGARGPRRQPSLLVRARDRRRQDGRRGGLRRGLAHGRRADPHPPSQPVDQFIGRSPTAATRSAFTGAPGRRRSPLRPGHRRDLPVVRAQRGGASPDAYSIVVCDEAHTALGEKTSACIRNWTARCSSA